MPRWFTCGCLPDPTAISHRGAGATSFDNMRMLVTVGCAIYQAGYLFGYLLGAVDETFLYVVYNIADFVGAMITNKHGDVQEVPHAKLEHATFVRERTVRVRLVRDRLFVFLCVCACSCTGCS